MPMYLLGLSPNAQAGGGDHPTIMATMVSFNSTICVGGGVLIKRGDDI